MGSQGQDALNEQLRLRVTRLEERVAKLEAAPPPVSVNIASLNDEAKIEEITRALIARLMGGDGK